MTETIDKTPEQIAHTERLDAAMSDIERLRIEASVLMALFNPEAEPAKDIG